MRSIARWVNSVSFTTTSGRIRILPGRRLPRLGLVLTPIQQNSNGNTDYNRDRLSGNDYNRNSKDNNRNDSVETPNIRSNNGGGRPERAEPNNHADNGNLRGGSNRSEAPQSGGNAGHRGPR